MTGAQVREARRLLGWSADRLNAWADLPTGTVELYERTGLVRSQRKHAPAMDRLGAIRTTLEAAGVEFLEQAGGGLGVRLKAAS